MGYAFCTLLSISLLENPKKLKTAGARVSSDEPAGCSFPSYQRQFPSAALGDSVAPHQQDKTNITLTARLEQSSEGQVRKGGILTV